MREEGPSDAEQWRERLVEFQRACLSSGSEDQAERLRQAHRLLAIGHQFSPDLPSEIPDAGRLEELLAAGAFETAAISLLGRDSGFMLSRGTNGNCMASVILPGNEYEVTAFGRTLALALLSAEAGALVRANQ